MGKTYIKRIPELPRFEKNKYEIPKSYIEEYDKEGIINPIQQRILYHITQHGGFRIKNIPQYFKEHQFFLEDWCSVKYDKGFYKFRSNSNFISTFGHVSVQPIKWKNQKVRYLKDEEVIAIKRYFTNEEWDDIQTQLHKTNQYYKNIKLGFRKIYSGLTPKDKIDISRFNPVPYLGARPLAGGRWYQENEGSSYQRVSSDLRPLLTINGEATSEIDLRAAILQFLESAFEKFEDRVVTPGDLFVDFYENQFTKVIDNFDFSKKDIKKTVKLLVQEFSKNKYSNFDEIYPNFKKMYDFERDESLSILRNISQTNIMTQILHHDSPKNCLYETLNLIKEGLGDEVKEGKPFGYSKELQTVRNILKHDDPYQYFLKTIWEKRPKENIDRETLKTVVYSILFCGKDKERKTAEYYLRTSNSKLKYAFFENQFPEFIDLLGRFKNIERTDEEGTYRIPPHVILYKEELLYAKEVLKKCCLEEGFTVLPVHDSFITTKPNADRLEEIMKSVSMDMYGKVLKYKKKY